MSDDVRLFLIAQVSLRIVIDISFMVIYIIRINKLDHMASNNFHSKPKLMKFKILLLVALQIIFALHIILSYADQSYWVSQYQNFSLITIAQIINCLLQIYIIRKQHKKKALKAASLPTLWIIWLLFDLTTIIYVEVKISSITVILLIFEAMVFVALVAIGCLLEEKNESKKDFLSNVSSPLIPQTRKSSQRQSQNESGFHDSNKLYIEFNKDFKISMKQNNRIFCQFKFAVCVGEESNVISKKEEDFISLVTEMQRSFPQNQQLDVDLKKNESFSNMTKYGEQKQKIYETYLVKLSQNEKYYIPYLLDFLQISQINRIKLTKKRQRHLFPKKDSFHNQQEQKYRKPFFEVEVVNGKIHVSNPQILEIVLNKSKGQIQRFHNKLISQKKLKMQLINEDPDISQLIHFIFRVVNSKQLWRPFSEWMVLGRQLEDKIYHMFDFWYHGFKSINISIIGYEIAFDKQGSIHTLYLVSLSQNKHTKLSNVLEQLPPIILKEDVTLKKRFNDFVKLDKSLRKFINNSQNEQQLQPLPPKFYPFGTKTSPKSRQIYLDNYLKDVVKLDEINHCVKFLQFLEVDVGRFKEQFHTIDEQNLARSRVSSMIIDQIDHQFH